MDDIETNLKSKDDVKTAFLDSKLSGDSTCSTRANNSSEFSICASDSLDNTTNKSSNEEEFPKGADPNENKLKSDHSYSLNESDGDSDHVQKNGSEPSSAQTTPYTASSEPLTKSGIGASSPQAGAKHQLSSSLAKSGLDSLMKGVDNFKYKVYDDDILDLDGSLKQRKYDDDNYSQFDTNTSTANSDSNSTTDEAETAAQTESGLASASETAADYGGNTGPDGVVYSDLDERGVFKDIFDPKNWDKSWTVYTKPKKDKSAELVSELYVFMLQLKLLNSLELVRAVCRPWGVPPHGNDYVFHFDQIANSTDLSLLQKYEEVFSPLYGKFKAGSPSVLWTRLADVDYFKIVFRLECIRFKQPFSSTIYENILRYTLSKLNEPGESSGLGASSDAHMGSRRDESAVGNLDSLNNKNLHDLGGNAKRTVCGICGNVVGGACSYCASMDNSPSNRVLINKVQMGSSASASHSKPVDSKNNAVKTECNGSSEPVIDVSNDAASDGVKHVAYSLDALDNGSAVNGSHSLAADSSADPESEAKLAIGSSDDKYGVSGVEGLYSLKGHNSYLGNGGYANAVEADAVGLGSYDACDSAGAEPDEWPERRMSDADGFTLTSFNPANELESPNVYKEDLATAFKYSAPTPVARPLAGAECSRSTSKDGSLAIVGSAVGEEEDLTSNDNNTRLISSDLVDASELDVTTHSNVDFSEHFLDHAGAAEAAGKPEGEGSEEEKKLKEAMLKNGMFRESVLKTNLFKDNPLTEHMLRKLDQDFNYDSYNRGYGHYAKREGESRTTVASSRSLEAGSSTRPAVSEAEQGQHVGGESFLERDYLSYSSDNYGFLDEDVLMRDEAILASLDEELASSELAEDNYHQVSDQDIEKIVLSVLNRKLTGHYGKFDQNPLVALYGSKSDSSAHTAESSHRSTSLDGYSSRGEKPSRRVKKKEDDYRNVDKYAYVENKYARMENRYNYMDYTPSYYAGSHKERKRMRDVEYEFPSFSRSKLTKPSKLDKQERARKLEKPKPALAGKPEAPKRKYELTSPFKSHLANISRCYRDGYYDDMIQSKHYALSKDKEIKISSHVVSASVSYDKRQQRFMAQWKTREGTKHSKSFYAKRYASPIMARKHAELYKMYILQHRVMNASELVEPTYEQLLANNFKDLDSINVGELDYDL